MIDSFTADAAFVLIDVQRRVDDLEHSGGSTGRRNNPSAEPNLASLLAAWRAADRPVFFTIHDSCEDASPLKITVLSGALKPSFEPSHGDEMDTKSTNGAFFGTDLELQRQSVNRLVVGGGGGVLHDHVRRATVRTRATRRRHVPMQRCMCDIELHRS